MWNLQGEFRAEVLVFCSITSSLRLVSLIMIGWTKSLDPGAVLGVNIED